MTTSKAFPKAWFKRDDDDDRRFYAQARLVVHIDDLAVDTVRAYLGEVLPPGGAVLDLMSSWRSHLPDGVLGEVVGLGMNEVELRENPQLTGRVVHDINRDPSLPFPDGRFDAAVVTVSVQYLTKPVEVFADVRRVLKPGALFHVIFSNRMFPTKAVAIWKALGPEQRARLIASYFEHAGGWSVPETADLTHPNDRGQHGDPVFIVRAAKEGPWQAGNAAR
ncbi:MAG: methyltransferase domain-containing protein [SAR202 cluster bacterium]|nr:methyltransferase domain-containing protein [SAR202 cluster bacterium]